MLSDAEGVGAIELNISCPNIKEGGIQFGCSLTGTYDVVSAVRKVTHAAGHSEADAERHDVASFARAAEEAGADAISLVNTFLAMAIDVETRRPKLTNVIGGLSGPAIRPIAVRMVWECYQAVKMPILGMGGIATAEDALEFIIAGASAVQVGTANFVDPFIWSKILDGISSYLERHSVSRVADLVGSRRHPAEDARVNRILVALDVSTGSRRAGARRHAPRRRRRLQDRQPALHVRGPVDRPRARRPRRSRVSGSEVSRHPEHGRRRGRGRRRSRRVDGERARGRRAGHAGSGQAGGSRGRGASGGTPPLVIAVTVLTSLDDATLREVGVSQHAARSGRAAGPADTGGRPRRRRGVAAGRRRRSGRPAARRSSS